MDREAQGERAFQAREGVSQWDFAPGKTISPQLLALEKGDNTGEGREVERSLAKVPQAILIWPRSCFHHTPTFCT